MTTLTQIKAFFPKINRFITERWKLIMVSLASVVILIGITSQVMLLSQNLKELDKLQKEKIGLVSELSYWQQIVSQYEGYRDAYFRIASLEYQLGQIDEAKKSVEKVLSLDPNFENARVLGDKIEAQR